MGCVYCATCLSNGKQYVGKTKVELATRQTQHYSQAKTKRRCLFHKALNKYGKDAFHWDILFESDDELLLYQKEKEFIASLKTFVPDGYNLTSGGDGNYNVHFDDEWRAKNQRRADALGRAVYCVETDTVYISYADAERATGVPQTTVRGSCRSKNHLTYCKIHFCYATEEEVAYLKQLKADGRLEKKLERSAGFGERVRAGLLGIKHSQEFCKRRSEIMLADNPWKGKHPSKETLQLMSENRRGKLVGVDNPSARAVLCVELDRTFPTMKIATQELGLPIKAGSNISSCCSGKLKTAYGYHWKYADTISSPIAENS